MGARITVLGTYHMASPGLDLVKPTIRDTLSPERQVEIELLVSRLSKFDPTKIAVEALPDGRINNRYLAYLGGKVDLSANEVEQVGFRLAEAHNHRELFGIDFHADMDFNKLVKFARAEGQDWFIESLSRLQTQVARNMEEVDRRFTVAQILAIYNSSEWLKLSHAVYLDMLCLNAGARYPGADVVAEWYKRNLIIFANLRRLVESSTDKILVLIGAGHVKILRDLIKDSSDLEWVDPLYYLPSVPDFHLG